MQVRFSADDEQTVKLKEEQSTSRGAYKTICVAILKLILRHARHLTGYVRHGN